MKGHSTRRPRRIGQLRRSELIPVSSDTENSLPLLFENTTVLGLILAKLKLDARRCCLRDATRPMVSTMLIFKY